MQVTDLARLAAIVREAGRRADVVVVSCHIGAEGESRSAITRANELFLGENRGNPYAFGHAAVDAGADIVFCHGPHMPRAIEVYRGRFIAYSLGNFWTYGRFNLQQLRRPGADRRPAGRRATARCSRPASSRRGKTGPAARSTIRRWRRALRADRRARPGSDTPPARGSRSPRNGAGAAGLRTR